MTVARHVQTISRTPRTGGPETMFTERRGRVHCGSNLVRAEAYFATARRMNVASMEREKGIVCEVRWEIQMGS